jgi:hypothetical protein
LKWRKVLPADVLRAYEDFSSRSLARIPSALERLIYVASTRDYNSGWYHHEGLAARFDPVAAAKALEYAHAGVFREVSLMPLEQLSDELEKYMQSAKEEPLAFLTAWQKLEPYRVAIPMHVDPTIAELFVSNIKIALAVLRCRLPKEPGHQSGASLPPSPAPRSLPQFRS